MPSLFYLSIIVLILFSFILLIYCFYSFYISCQRTYIIYINNNNQSEQANKGYQFIQDKQEDTENQFIQDKKHIKNHDYPMIKSPKYENNQTISSVYDAEGKYIQDKEKNIIFENFDNGFFQPLDKHRSIIDKTLNFRKENFKVYLINMKTSVQRFNRFMNEFNGSDISRNTNFERIEGVNGKEILITDYVSKSALETIQLAEKSGFRRYHYELTRGAVGCYLSHLEVYKKVVKQSEDYAFIFEDDVSFSSLNILEDVNQLVNTIPKDWDILLLGCVCFVCGKYSSYYDVNRYFLMHGYILKKSSANKILDLVQGKPIEQQIDAHFSDLADQGLLKIYCLRDKLAVQWNMGTDIQLPVKNIEGVNPFQSL